MEENQEIFGMLDLILRPGFCVKDNVIVKVNPSAQGLPIATGTDVRTLLQTGENEYAAFEEGCLYVQLSLLDEAYGASITRMDGWIFSYLTHSGDLSNCKFWHWQLENCVKA